MQSECKRTFVSPLEKLLSELLHQTEYAPELQTFIPSLEERISVPSVIILGEKQQINKVQNTTSHVRT